MARLNYYRFPEGIDDHTRYLAGADDLENMCSADNERWLALDNPHIDCPYSNADEESGWGCRHCKYFKCLSAGDTVEGISVSLAKELIKKYGGSAWTRHIDRDGGCFETTEIKLGGNNSRFKYNRHL